MTNHPEKCNSATNTKILENLSLPSGSDILPIYWSCRASAIYDLPINLRYIHKRVPALVLNQVNNVIFLQYVQNIYCIFQVRSCVFTFVKNLIKMLCPRVPSRDWLKSSYRLSCRLSRGMYAFKYNFSAVKATEEGFSSSVLNQFLVTVGTKNCTCFEYISLDKSYTLSEQVIVSDFWHGIYQIFKELFCPNICTSMSS